jgi:NADH:ubiquinone oxidoreductase subunit H
MLNFSIYSLIFNLIDVLCVILPILLAVAYMTIIERKALAAFQRRVGPNVVGRENKYLKDLCIQHLPPLASAAL